MPANEKRIPQVRPSNDETERAVLGSILLNNEILPDLGLESRHFYDTRNQKIFEAMCSLAANGSPIDAVTIGGELGSEGLKLAGGALYLSQLADGCITSANSCHYSRQLKDLAKRREMVDVCMDIAWQASEQNTSISEYMSASRNRIISLIDDTDDLADSVTATESADYAYEQLVSDGEPRGLVKTGIGKFDSRFGGLWPGLLTVLASRPSMGKSCYSLNIAANACLAGKRVLLISLEDPRNFVCWRMMSRLANVSIDKMLNKNLTPGDKQQLEIARNKVKCMDMHIVDKGGMTSEKIKSTCISHKNKHDIDLVVIDHLGHINEPGRSLYESTSNAARTIATIPGELDIPVLLLHQLSRAPETRDDPTPRLSDLRQSGEVEQLARAVWFLYRPGYYSEEADPNELALIVAKNSHGPTSMLQLWCDMPRMHISDGGEEW